MIDSTKVGRNSLLTIFRAQDPDEIVTDDNVAADSVARYRAAGVNLVVAETKPVAVR
jgi:DeoR/GlpR family transcriptional regulator of sugar metabolism